MSFLAKNVGASGALFEISGTVANNATWEEDIYFMEAGVGMDISDLDWKMTFRSVPDSTTADLTLSIDESTLSIENDDDSVMSILRITVTPGILSNFIGDYIADLAAQDTDDKVTLWAHGTVSFTPNPVTF
jgi:hypothetical protein